MNDNELLAAVGYYQPQIKSEAPYTEGPTNAKILFVGEAAGADEERYQRPFIGAAGDMLTRLCASAGIMRHNCRLDNVFQFHPFKNNINPYISYDDKRHSVRVSQRFFDEQAKLKERLSQCSANVIVPLGNVALYALTGKWGITKWRGSILESTLLPGRKVIPTIHPNAALRQWSDQPLIVHDLKRVLDNSEFPDIRLLKRYMNLFPTCAEALQYIAECEKLPIVAIDTEVTGRSLSHISIAKSATDIICIPFYDAGHDNFTLAEEAQLFKALARLLRNPNVVKLGHNMSFDASFLYSAFGMVVRPIDDTMIMSRIIQPDMPASLAFAVSIYCNGEPYYKDDGKLWIKDPLLALSVGVDVFRRYNAMDSAVLMEMYPQLMLDVKRQGNMSTYQHQVALVEPLCFMQNKGIRVNTKKMKELSLQAEQTMLALSGKINAEVGYQLNPASSKQCMEYFYDERGQKAYTKTVKDKKTGERKQVKTVDVKALRRLSAKGFEVASLILDYRKLYKLRGTYLEMKLDDDGRMRCSYNPVGTRYGRISSSKTIWGTGANLLNQPKGMKMLMYPEDGYIFVNIDLSQAENRCVAYMWGVRKMIEAFETGADVHCATASSIFNKPPEEISDEEGSTDIGNGTLSERDIGKRANHAFNYGLSAQAFSINNEIELSAAQNIYAKYHARYPEIHAAHRAIQEQISRQKIMINAYGRKYYMLRRFGPDLFEAAYAFGPQSTVADKLNRDGFMPVYYDQKNFHDVILINQVYDSVVFEYPIAKIASLPHICALICKRLEAPVPNGTHSFVIPPDVSVGMQLAGMRKVKLAQVYDSRAFSLILEDVIGATTTGLDRQLS